MDLAGREENAKTKLLIFPTAFAYLAIIVNTSGFYVKRKWEHLHATLDMASCNRKDCAAQRTLKLYEMSLVLDD